MGGIIVIDFIDMQTNEHKQQIYDRMKELMERDRAKHTILPLSKFGLMQITRQRVRPEMNIDTLEKCPSCNGTGLITPAILLTDQIESKLAYFIGKYQLRKVILKTHPYIAAYLTKGFISLRIRWAWRYRCRIIVREMESYQFLEYHFFNKEEEELL